MCCKNAQPSYISTLSTLTPHGSVASSKAVCMMWEIVSRSDKISAKFFVPSTFRSVVAASKRVEWLKSSKSLFKHVRKWYFELKLKFKQVCLKNEFLILYIKAYKAEFDGYVYKQKCYSNVSLKISSGTGCIRCAGQLACKIKQSLL